MGGNYYGDFRCDLFDFARGFIGFITQDTGVREETNINITNNITIINNNTIVDSQNDSISTAIVFY